MDQRLLAKIYTPFIPKLIKDIHTICLLVMFRMLGYILERPNIVLCLKNSIPR